MLKFPFHTDLSALLMPFEISGLSNRLKRALASSTHNNPNATDSEAVRADLLACFSIIKCSAVMELSQLQSLKEECTYMKLPLVNFGIYAIGISNNFIIYK
jgi:hypothetical protein